MGYGNVLDRLQFVNFYSNMTSELFDYSDGNYLSYTEYSTCYMSKCILQENMVTL